MKTKTYSEKLKDPRWQKKRLQVLERDKFQCKSYFDDTSTLHVHHIEYSYGKEPWEYELNKLTTLCDDCHASIHILLNKIKKDISSFIRFVEIDEVQSIIKKLVGKNFIELEEIKNSIK